MNNPQLSIILPCYNEAHGLELILPKLCDNYKAQEIIVVDDGSLDHTSRICEKFNIKYIKHLYNKGNGAAIKTGAREATGKTLIFLDADGQHQVSDIENLLSVYNQGYDMVVGSRHKLQHANILRYLGNKFYNRLASLIVGHHIEDLTSGFRIVDANKFKQFLNLLPNGFSYPTTITISFYRNAYSVKFQPIDVKKRIGNSHLNLFTDGFRFFIIIYKISVLYSPLKIFLPLSLLHFMLGISYYAYTYITQTRFTNMSLMLLTSAVIIFLIGLVSEQITILLYQNKVDKDASIN